MMTGSHHQIEAWYGLDAGKRTSGCSEVDKDEVLCESCEVSCGDGVLRASQRKREREYGWRHTRSPCTTSNPAKSPTTLPYVGCERRSKLHEVAAHRGNLEVSILATSVRILPPSSEPYEPFRSQLPRGERDERMRDEIENEPAAKIIPDKPNSVELTPAICPIHRFEM